jgi:hypothetical protein
MAKLNGGPLHPSKQGPSVFEQNSSFFFYRRKPMTIKKKNLFTGPVSFSSFFLFLFYWEKTAGFDLWGFD